MNQIYFTGYDAIHPENFIFDVPEGHDCYLLLITSTPACFYVNGVEEEYPAHSAILYPPHHKIWYSACGEYYGNDWIRFASDESFVRNFPKQTIPFSISDPEYYHNLFQMITWETALLMPSSDVDYYITDSGYSEIIISQLLRILFQKLHTDVCQHGSISHEHELLMLRKKIYNSPQLPWTVLEMANELHISTGYLHILYKNKFGISCMDDVIAGRIRMVKDMLAYTDKNITEIAEECGYNNTEHLCRQFLKNCGITPSRYRKESNKPNPDISSLYRTVSGLNL